MDGEHDFMGVTCHETYVFFYTPSISGIFPVNAYHHILERPGGSVDIQGKTSGAGGWEQQAGDRDGGGSCDRSLADNILAADFHIRISTE